jgi:hypothetical protein
MYLNRIKKNAVWRKKKCKKVACISGFREKKTTNTHTHTHMEKKKV